MYKDAKIKEHKFMTFDMQDFAKKIQSDNQTIDNPFNLPLLKVLLIAKSGGGKSLVIKNILYDMQTFFSNTHVVCKTESEQGFFRNFIPNQNIFFHVDINKLENYVQYSKQKVKQIKKKYKQYGLATNPIQNFIPPQFRDMVLKYDKRFPYDEQYSRLQHHQFYYNEMKNIVASKIYRLYKKNPSLIQQYFSMDIRCLQRKIIDQELLIKSLVQIEFDEFNPLNFIIFDDVLDNKKFMKHPIMGNLLFNSRHSQVVMFFATQYLNKVDRDLRSNFNFVICLALSDESIKEDIRKQYASFLCKNDFQLLYDYLTRDYGCMIINTSNPSLSGLDQVLHYKADGSLLPVSFQIGSIKQQLLRPLCKDLDDVEVDVVGEKDKLKIKKKIQNSMI